MKKQDTKKLEKIILTLVFIISIILLIVSLFNIFKWSKDNIKTSINVDEIQTKTTINEIEDDDKTEIIEEVVVHEGSLYYKYIKMNLIDVDFDELIKFNSDTVGWIQVNGTNINYPFVHTDNNEYYLNHSIDGSYNDAGWIFADYRNKVNGTDKNLILYGHSRLDKSMFGTLKNILKDGWLDNEDNFVVKLSTPKENTLWQIFSVYHIETTTDYIQTEFSSDSEYQNFLNTILNRSMYNFNTSVSSSDQILTLSTCYNDNEKLVVHAKMIKKSSR